MKQIKSIFILLVIFQAVIACKKSDPPQPVASKKQTVVGFKQTNVDLTSHKLATFSIIKDSKYLVVFEAGMGDDHTIWNKSNIALKTSEKMDVLTYDRASHGQSKRGPDPRDINRLQSELTGIINAFANDRKIVLIGHSLGGFIIQDWAIKNPSRVAGLLFVDPSTDAFGGGTQEQQDAYYNSWVKDKGPTYGSTLEAKEWKKDVEYMATLGNLPDVPTIVLTAMKPEAPATEADLQPWYDAHESLGIGITDFTHISIPNSAHMVMIDQPQILIDNINLLLSKLP